MCWVTPAIAAEEGASAAREVKAAGKEIELFLGATPVTLDLPAPFFGAFYDDKSGVAIKDSKQTATISPLGGSGVPEQGVPVLLVTQPKRVYALRVKPAKDKPADKQVILQDPSAAAVYSREVTVSTREEPITVGENEPTVAIFRSNIARVYKNNASPLWVESADNFLVFFPKYEVTPVGDPLLVELDDGRLYGLRAFPSSAAKPREHAVLFRDTGVVPVYGQEIVYKPGAAIVVSMNEPTAVFFPSNITTKFNSNELVGIDVRKHGKRLVIIPYPTPVPPTNRLTVELDTKQKYDLKLVQAGKGARRMWSVKLK